MRQWKILLLMLFVITVVVHPQEESTGTVNFKLNPFQFLNKHGFGKDLKKIEILIKNTYKPKENPKKLEIFLKKESLILSPKGNNNNKKLNENKKFLLRKNFGEIFVASNNIHAKISLENWRNINNAAISYDYDSDSFILENLPLPPSKHRFTISVWENKEEKNIILKTVKEIIEEKSCSIEIKKSSAFDLLIKKHGTKESLFLSIIFALVAIIIGALKSKVQAGAEWILDKLGKYGKGKLAERRFLKRYFEHIIFTHQFLKIVGFNTAGISRPQLEEVYISLRVSNFDLSYKVKNGISTDNDCNENKSIPFSKALKQCKKMVILGTPGAGKTTILSYTLLMFARNKAERQFEIKDKLIPIFIPLRRLTHNDSILESITNPKSGIISKDILKECPKNYFEEKLKKGECIVLLDGLDEVTDEKKHRQVAQKVNNMLGAYPGNRFIVTCRIAGWKNLLTGFKILETRNFNRNEIHRFIRGWHKAIITQEERNKLELDKKEFQKKWKVHLDEKVKPAIDLQSNRLIDTIDKNNRILAIAVNPMLLSLICLIHYNRSVLPKGRTILYNQCIEFLVDSWDRSRDILSVIDINLTQKESILREIAFQLHLSGKGEDTRENIIAIIEKKAPELGIKIDPKELLEIIEERSGLLVERSINIVGFSHLTLQEHLTAQYIQKNPGLYPLIKDNFDMQEWREVILLYSGLLDDATRLINDIIENKTLDRLIFAGYCISDVKRCNQTTAGKIVDKLLHQLTFNNERTEGLINVLSTIASDFSGEAVGFSEILSKKLIDNLKGDDDLLKKHETSVISILGKAKVTRVLPVLIDMINKDQALRSTLIDAITSFGNLALTHIKKHIAAGIKPGEIEPLVSILIGINTTSSAKFLIELYNLNIKEYDKFISLALSQMLKDPTISDDLKKIETGLPQRLQKNSIPRDGWPHENLSTNSLFNFLDAKLREDTIAIMDDISTEEKLELESGPPPHQIFLKKISFKVLFPAFLSYIKKISELPSFKLLNVLGFDVKTHSNEKKAKFLIRQIQKAPSSDLKFSIKTIKQNKKTESYNIGEKKERRWIIKAANVYFVLFFLWNFYFSISTLLSYFFKIYEPGFQMLLFSFLFLLLYIFLIVLSRIKLERKFLSKYFCDILFCPIKNSLRILPYISKSSAMVKCYIFLVILSIFSPITGGFLEQPGLILSFNSYFILLLLIPTGIFIVLGVLYYRNNVLGESPIYHLLLLHPGGQNEVIRHGEAQ
ncbi:MAG: NACHT domain-containing protein [Candidatus Aminicenantes bacterium]|nr:NACHT domain-containing protein [Candidatus Aminicenantes bacterium]